MTIKLSQNLQTTCEQVYASFTNATYLREWLADGATVNPQPGGRIYLWWGNGGYTAGEYVELIPQQKVVFTWRGKDEPASQVSVHLREQAGSVTVDLEHSGLEWASPEGIQEFERQWKSSLDNLRSVLETGLDVRIYSRPMLGILLSDFNPEIAAKMGIPVTEGVRIDSLIEGMGAQKAGLMNSDVIVQMNGQPISSFATIGSALRGKKAGDEVEVVYYRGAEKQSVHMQLAGRPVPQFSWDPKELAEQIRKRNQASLDELGKAFAWATEAQASHHPAPGEWSAKEVMAHLIVGERQLPLIFLGMLDGQELVSDGFINNSNAWVEAVVSQFPTINCLLEELKCNMEENCAFIANIPLEQTKRKSSYFRMASLWDGLSGHTNSHLEQIRKALVSE